ncbi:alpha/beta hydrolase [Actinomadura miaoliensis]|uniref:Alpha/beta hydrolase n=1 Tax=Actinomadura miaoliensis TaxID=430685 RepID=A0ABP7V558_9ACTN
MALKTRALATVTGLSTLSAALAFAVPAASAETVPALPPPTGSRQVGMTSLYLKDTSRPDTWVPSVNARELMVSLWYPAKAHDGQRAPYMTSNESQALLKGSGITGVPGDVLSKTRTHAFRDALPVGRVRGMPLVVLSPGLAWQRSSLTSLAEDLASRGYVVAGIDHTYETHATTFPDGRVTTCVACTVPAEERAERAIRGRAADVSFVLDQLLGRHSKWKGSVLIDPSRIAMVGMSLGGGSVPETMLRDTRVRAGLNLDGPHRVAIPERGLQRPYMILGQARPDATWDRDWPHVTGWKRWLAVHGAIHSSFTDYDTLTQQIGVDQGSRLPGNRSVEITRAYVRAFMDLHLRHRPQPLLDKPSARHPEVTFEGRAPHP